MKKVSIKILIILFILLFIPNQLLATITTKENFESYADNDSMNGKAGGSGWAAAWSTSDSSVLVSNANPANGSLSAEDVTDTGGAGDTQRTFTAASAGIIYISIRDGDKTKGGANRGLLMGDAGHGNHILLFFGNTAGDISIFFNGAYVKINDDYTNNQWYRFGIEWDNAVQPDKIRYNVDGGAWSAWGTVNGSFSDLSLVKLYKATNAPATTIAWDEINTEYAFESAATTSARRSPIIIQEY